MSKIDEFISSHRVAIEQATDILTQYGHKLTTEETNGLQGEILTHEDCIKELEQLRPYVELGELVVRSGVLDTTVSIGKVNIKKLLQQIREQENGRTE